jgi:hypothetical protein
MELGQTNNPRQLVPGNSAAIADVAGAMHAYGNALHASGTGLAAIEKEDVWSGAAADAFRKRFHGHPEKWIEAAACFHDAATALDDYAPTLDWAQQEAADAITLWNQGQAQTSQAKAQHAQAVQQAQQQAARRTAAGVPTAPPSIPFADPGEVTRQAARDKLSRARSQVGDAGDRAARTVRVACDKAPQKPGFWSHVGDFFSGFGHDMEHLGADVANALASTGNAAIHHPFDVLGMLAGGSLAAVSAAGEGAGLVLDATGAGAVAGVPLNVVSAAGVVAGGVLAMASAEDLASHAAGDDTVEPVQVDDGGDTGSPAQDPQHFQDLGMDPATGQFRQGEAETASRIENQTGVHLERSPDANGPDWKGSDGKTYDAVGNFPGKYFDQQWPNLQARITDHLGKADYVPVDVSQFSPEQIAQVQQYIQQFGSRVFIVGGG